MSPRFRSKPVKFAATLLAVGAAVLLSRRALNGIDLKEMFGIGKSSGAAVEGPAPAPPQTPQTVHGIHLSAWAAGSKKMRVRIDDILDHTEINTVVIAIKEYEGEVYISGVPDAVKHKTFVNAIPDLKEYVAELKKRGIYTIARIVTFKDTKMAQARPDWAVRNPDGTVWKDRKGNSWLDPYNKKAWEYDLSIATRAVEVGFQEIQFDYIRFPTDGDMKLCRYSYAHHTSSTAARALDEFLDEAARRIKPLGAKVSIDVFGLTPSARNDMGIGQKIVGMEKEVDYVSPMTYPSHYAKGEYGIPDPNRVPYRVVHKTMYDAIHRLGKDIVKMRPYLQDFSLGYHYGPKEVRAQIEACEDLGIKSWLLWSPSCHYTKLALRDKEGKLSSQAQVPKEWKTWPEKEEGKKKPEVSASSAAVRSPSVSRSTAPVLFPREPAAKTGPAKP